MTATELRSPAASQVTTTRVATHRLTRAEDLTGQRPVSGGAARTTRGLDLDAYSRMKHGDLRAVGQLAAPLACALVDQVPSLVTDGPVPVLPIAYKAVRPACWFLARAVLDVLDRERSDAGLAPGRIVRVAKGSVTTTDYATSSAAARSAELDRIAFRLDEDVDGTQLVVVDDVRVTGAAEATILRALATSRPARVVLGYLAVVDGALATDPAVEARLNHGTVRSCADMAGAVERGEFALTIRFLKRLLQTDRADRAAFLAVCPPTLLHEILDGAAATGEEFCATFAAPLADVAEGLRSGAGAEGAR
ncbi:phosphoribosyltransferase family protein [Isoptericola sp. NEAU-Y5]|uniref:Phosphoribosyltransferase family protein n=1 Tax=Isoptericola luteus TaxID=2879484 RepID=A0ABS7ZBH2_9MICO|nr:phosphoribosyltransferase family protein [Isoptericola sp. NEAU-Y5]MCA5891822.1 phosphoribosyltransferase family protein [Isoptericola sp. NEAU-Y5]